MKKGEKIQRAIIASAERNSGIVKGGNRVDVETESKMTPNIYTHTYYTVNNYMTKLVKVGLFIETLTNIRSREGREWKLA